MTLLSLAKRADVAPFLAMDVLVAAREEEAKGRHIIHMELGEPSTQTPERVRRAAIEALEHAKIGYTQALGTPELRAALSRHYQTRYGVEVPASRIAVTAGSSGAFNLAFLALFNPGDRIGLPIPTYPAYRNILTALGLVPVPIAVGPETRWAITPEILTATHSNSKLAGLIIASPGNPSGTLMSPDALEAIVRACKDMGIWLISDEIYHGLVYDGAEQTALAYDDHVVVVNSFSKYFCMTGWRIGWMVMPEQLVRPIERIAQNLYISTNALSQAAALAAFDAVDEFELVKQGYARNRQVLLEALPKLGITRFLPVDGAFYVYADIAHLTNDSIDFTKRLLMQAGIAATPGPDFDAENGHRFMRFSFAGRETDMVEAMARLERWL